MKKVHYTTFFAVYITPRYPTDEGKETIIYYHHFKIPSRHITNLELNSYEFFAVFYLNAKKNRLDSVCFDPALCIKEVFNLSGVSDTTKEAVLNGFLSLEKKSSLKLTKQRRIWQAEHLQDLTYHKNEFFIMFPDDSIPLLKKLKLKKIKFKKCVGILRLYCLLLEKFWKKSAFEDDPLNNSFWNGSKAELVHDLKIKERTVTEYLKVLEDLELIKTKRLFYRDTGKSAGLLYYRPSKETEKLLKVCPVELCHYDRQAYRKTVLNTYEPLKANAV